MYEQIKITKQVIDTINDKQAEEWTYSFTQSVLELILANQLEIMKKMEYEPGIYGG